MSTQLFGNVAKVTVNDQNVTQLGWNQLLSHKQDDYLLMKRSREGKTEPER